MARRADDVGPMDEKTDKPGAGDAGGALPVVTTEKSATEIVAALGKMSKRGELPGFEKDGARGLFCVEAQGAPFDRSLVAHARGGEGLTRLEWELVTPRRWPIAMAVVLAVSVWPGLPITHSLLVTYFPGWYGGLVSGWFATWMWYLPLTVIPIPWVWRSVMRKMRASTHASAVEAIGKIARAVDGEIEGA